MNQNNISAALTSRRAFNTQGPIMTVASELAIEEPTEGSDDDLEFDD